MREITAEDFRLYPADVVEAPIFDDEDGNFWGYGHIDPEVFVKSVKQLLSQLFGSMEEAEEYYSLDYLTEGNVFHAHAITVVPEHWKHDPDSCPEDDWLMKLVKSDTEGAYPITRWSN